ncbi:MAG: hypothetical protein M3Y21_11455 [Candidatus Eremiobacteraeota bacterium]|nr:hypothetical protein [Candidatus Eremiobacteraeota bacterium]
MRSLFLALVLLIGATPLPATASRDPISSRFRISDCTVVAVAMYGSVNSADAHPGDFFRFEVLNAVTRENTIVIPARTMGYGIVALASPAGRGGRAGTLVLEPRYLVMPGGGHVGVVLDHRVIDLERNGKSDSVPGYLGAIPIPGVGAAIGIFNYFHHGKDIEVPKGTIFAIFPDDSPDVESCQQ